MNEGRHGFMLAQQQQRSKSGGHGGPNATDATAARTQSTLSAAAANPRRFNAIQTSSPLPHMRPESTANGDKPDQRAFALPARKRTPRACTTHRTTLNAPGGMSAAAETTTLRLEIATFGRDALAAGAAFFCMALITCYGVLLHR